VAQKAKPFCRPEFNILTIVFEIAGSVNKQYELWGLKKKENKDRTILGVRW